MPPLRESCPSCGTPANAGLRRRPPEGPGGRTPEELKHNRKTVLIACAAIFAVLGVAGKLNWHIPHGIHFDIDAPHRKGPVVTTAEDLVRAYADDPHAAAKRFDGREIQVSGEFLRIVPDGYGSIDMRLKTDHPDILLGIDLDSRSVDAATKLEPGQTVTVSCRRVAGSGDDPWLADCVLQPPATGAEASAAPSPPAAPTAPTAPRPR